jgi:phosphoketolase
MVCRKECFQDGTGIIASHTEAMAAGNIIAGGVIGLGIDAASGAMNRYNAENQIALVPVQGCRARA